MPAARRQWRALQGLLALCAGAATAAVADSSTVLLPTLGQQAAYGVSSGLQSVRSELRLRLEQSLPAKVQLTASAAVGWDDRDRLEPGAVRDRNRTAITRRAALGNRSDAELRDLHLDWTLRDWQFRVGKQQIVWGDADGIKVLDLVNPQNFREGLLESFDRSRIGLWSLQMTRALGSRSSVEFVVLPDLSFHDIPSRDALFDIRSPRLSPPRPPGAGAVPIRTIRPELAPETLEYGMRLRTAVDRWEFQAMGLRHFSDVPLQRLSFDALGRPLVERRYHLTSTAGAGFSRPLGPLLIRGEGTYTDAAPLPALERPDDPRTALAPQVAGLLAADLSVRSTGLISMQVAERRSLVGTGQLPSRHQQRYATALIRDEIASWRLGYELYGIYAFADDDWLIRLRGRHQLDDRVALEFGADVFTGNREGVFGQHRNLDRLIAGVELTL